jgi:hypothetical protein
MKTSECSKKNAIPEQFAETGCGEDVNAVLSPARFLLQTHDNAFAHVGVFLSQKSQPVEIAAFQRAPW